ncbi:MAG: hypothetical protein ACJ79L_00385 [Anaeromyxobacteraceae bacterium]
MTSSTHGPATNDGVRSPEASGRPLKSQSARRTVVQADVLNSRRNGVA